MKQSVSYGSKLRARKTVIFCDRSRYEKRDIFNFFFTLIYKNILVANQCDRAIVEYSSTRCHP